MTRTVVVGQGYVGLPLAMAAIDAGHEVVGFDVDGGRVDRLRSGRSFIEDVSDSNVAAALASGRYLPTVESDACAGFDVGVITVPTPLREGTPDLSFIESAGTILARHLRPGALVVLESTTYPGTTDEVLAPILESGSGLRAGVDFALGYSPERIDPGNPVWKVTNTPKVIAGIDQESCRAVGSFYGEIVESTVAVSNTRTAELTKLLENTFRHVNIALANEMAVFASELGIDIWEAIDAAATKPYGFMRFNPGPGVGGHCLPIDPVYLSWQVKRSLGRPFRFVELANDVNDRMPDHVIERVMRILNAQRKPVNGSRILLLGLAYKRNSSDLRESPALLIVEHLLSLGAQVMVSDPHVLEKQLIPSGTEYARITEETLGEVDLVILVTDHDSFPYELILERSRLIFDTRGRLEGPNVVKL